MSRINLATAFAAAQTVLARYSSLSMSAPFGGAAGAAALGDKVADMTVLDRYGRHFHMQGASGIRAQSSGLLAGVMLTPVDPPWLMPSTTDARFGFLSPATTTGYWQGARSNRPAFASFSPARGQTVTLGANVAIDGGASLTGTPLRGIGATPVGMTSSWSGSGWSASFASGTSRDRRTGQRTVAITTPLGIGLELTDLAERGRVLGLSGGQDLGLEGASTTMATLTMRRTVAGLMLSARATAANTRVRGGSELMRFDQPVLGTAFAVCSKHVKSHGRRQRRLGITPGHFDVGAPKPALAIGFDPSKHGGENKRLPGFKGNRLARKRPFDMGQALDEGAQIIGRIKTAALLIL